MLEQIVQQLQIVQSEPDLLQGSAVFLLVSQELSSSNSSSYSSSNNTNYWYSNKCMHLMHKHSC